MAADARALASGDNAQSGVDPLTGGPVGDDVDAALRGGAGGKVDRSGDVGRRIVDARSRHVGDPLDRGRPRGQCGVRRRQRLGADDSARLRHLRLVVGLLLLLRRRRRTAASDHDGGQRDREQGQARDESTSRFSDCSSRSRLPGVRSANGISCGAEPSRSLSPRIRGDLSMPKCAPDRNHLGWPGGGRRSDRGARGWSDGSTSGISGWLRATNRNPDVIRLIRRARRALPGDPDFGDPLSAAGDGGPQAAARAADRLLERDAATREVSLATLQLWQALTERVSGRPRRRRGDDRVHRSGRASRTGRCRPATRRPCGCCAGWLRSPSRHCWTPAVTSSSGWATASWWSFAMRSPRCGPRSRPVTP